MASGIERLLTRHGCFLIALLVLGWGTYNLCLSVYPIDGDNLAALDLGANKDISALLRGSSILGLPFYRPVPYITIILQYRLFGLDTPLYFLFNLGVWIACAWCVYLLVARIAKSRIAALAAGALLLVDPRAFQALVWIGERQSTMSGLFGLGAILLAMIPSERRWQNRRRVAIFLLLLLAPLSKEYGLAFSGALVLFALLSNRRDWKMLIVIALVAVTTYCAIRLYSGVLSVTDYCEDMGFFREERLVCYHELAGGERLAQHAYNVVASFAGTFFPRLFSEYGAIQPSLRELVIANVPVFLFALVGFIKSPRTTLPLFALIVLNALLSFVLYRERNQVVGMLGLYAAAGIGLAALVQSAICKRHLIIKWAVALALTAILICQITWSTPRLVRYYTETKQFDPCRVAERFQLDLELVRRLKEHYQMDDPGCAILGS